MLVSLVAGWLAVPAETAKRVVCATSRHAPVEPIEDFLTIAWRAKGGEKKNSEICCHRTTLLCMHACCPSSYEEARLGADGFLGPPSSITIMSRLPKGRK